jgi:hypothetical protein
MFLFFLSYTRSLNDLSEFNPKGGKFIRKDFSYKRGRGGSHINKSKKGKPNRPGKAARAQKRSSNKSSN